MFKWLTKVKWWRRGPKGPVVHDYGQYVFKPVISRAISVVVNVSQAEVMSWVQDPEIDLYLNDELIVGTHWTRRRLESGNYEIKIPSQDKVWRFFIA